MSERLRTPEDFVAHLAIVTAAIGNRPLDQDLGVALNAEFPVAGSWFASAVALCRKGVEEGWLWHRPGKARRRHRGIAGSHSQTRSARAEPSRLHSPLPPDPGAQGDAGKGGSGPRRGEG